MTSYKISLNQFNQNINVSDLNQKIIYSNLRKIESLLKLNKIIPAIVKSNRIMMVVVAYTFFLLLKITCPVDVKICWQTG